MARQFQSMLCWIHSAWLLFWFDRTVSFHTSYSTSSGYSHVKVENDGDGYSYETKVFHGSPLSRHGSFQVRSLDDIDDYDYRYAPHFYSSLDYHIIDLDLDLLELELDSDLDLDLDFYLSLYGLNYLGKSRHFWRTGKHIPSSFGHLYGVGLHHLGPSFGLGYGLGYSLGYGYDKYGVFDDHIEHDISFDLDLDNHLDIHHADLDDDDSDEDIVSGSSWGWFK